MPSPPTPLSGKPPPKPPKDNPLRVSQVNPDNRAPANRANPDNPHNLKPRLSLRRPKP